MDNMEDNVKLVASIEDPVELINPAESLVGLPQVPHVEESKDYPEAEDHAEILPTPSPDSTPNELPDHPTPVPSHSITSIPPEASPQLPDPSDSHPSSTRRPEDLPFQNFEFSVHFNTNFGEKIIVVGSTPELGNWEVSKGLALEWTEGHIWKTTVPVTDNSAEFKYVCVSETCSKWEEGANRNVSAGRVEANDTWQ